MLSPSQARDKQGEASMRAPAALALAGLVTFGILARELAGYTIDDAYIYFRYATNFAEGRGLAFNPGESPRVEGITSLVYALFLSIAAIAGLDLVAFAKWTGLAASLLASGLSGIVIWRLVRTYVELPVQSSLVASVGGAVYHLTNPYGVAAGLSGLETAAASASYAGFLLAATTMTARRAALLGAAGRLSVMGFVVHLLRPEMVVSVVIMMGVIALRPGPARRIALLALAYLLSFGVAYHSLRLLYYELPFPLPFYIKQSTDALPGLIDLSGYLTREIVALVLAGVGVALLSRPGTDERLPPIPTAIATALSAQLAYYATVSHVMGFGYRFFLPSSVAVVTLGAVGAAALYRALRRTRPGSLWVPVLSAAMPLSFVGNVLIARAPARALFIDWYAEDAQDVAEVGRTIRDAVGARPFRIALNDCGAIPFFARVSTLDLAGLNNRAIALGRSAAAAREETARLRPDLVILVGAAKHDVGAIRGWEKLSHHDLVELGYTYAGTMTFGRMPDGSGYHLLVYANDAPLATAVLRNLSTKRLLERGPPHEGA
jgi:hypothetical protein